MHPKKQFFGLAELPERFLEVDAVRNGPALNLSRPGRQPPFYYYIIKVYNFVTRLHLGINYIKLKHQQLTLIS